MIIDTINLLLASSHIKSNSEYVKFARGKYQYPKTISDCIKKLIDKIKNK